MKKFFFCIFALSTLIFLYSVLKIVFVDLSRLTQYGYGYLFGEVLLLFVFGGLTFALRKAFFKKE